MTELATQAPGEPSSDQRRGEGDEDEEEECVYMFRYPRGSPEVNRSASHPESPSTFLTVALRVCVCVCVCVCVRVCVWVNQRPCSHVTVRPDCFEMREALRMLCCVKCFFFF